MKIRILTAAILGLLVALATVLSASAHVHVVETGNGEEQELANGQNHPGFVEQEDGTFESCEGVEEPEDAGPSGYGLETAHHGPDEGTPGAADGCYASDGPPDDENPAID